MNRLGITATLTLAIMVLPFWNPASRAEDAHHPAQGTPPAQTQSPPQATPSPAMPPEREQPPNAQGQVQPDQMQSGMTMNCPMMQGGQTAQIGVTCPMMQGQGSPGGPGMMMHGMGRGPQGQTQGMGPGTHQGPMRPAEMSRGEMSSEQPKSGPAH